jgi:hypothetical protein
MGRKSSVCTTENVNKIGNAALVARRCAVALGVNAKIVKCQRITYCTQLSYYKNNIFI